MRNPVPRLDRFVGKWVALDGRRVIAHGESAVEVYNKIQAILPPRKAEIFRVPESEEIPLL